MPDPRRIPLPWSRSCFVCGEANPIGLRARSWIVDDAIELEFTPSERLAGWNGVTHGGLVATVLDEVMTWAAIIHSDRACFAADFNVRLRRPLPPETSVVAQARADRSRRGIVFTTSSMESADGALFATAEGRYMAIPEAELRAKHHDLVAGPGCWSAEHIFGSPLAPGRTAQPGSTGAA
jgi:acyl-coenzyme A thioesterase PaaI-like protein